MKVESIVVLTGAGISAESGIRTFRDADGLWENHRIEDVASPDGFHRNPALVHEFYNARRHQLLSPDVSPNDAHDALARLEAEFPGRLLVVTQNIDDLHERAGSTRLIHMHGELLKSVCARSGTVFNQRLPLSVSDTCECCGEAGQLRPYVVWFGETPLRLPEIFAALRNCDVFASIGTSGNVYPAAGFVEVAVNHGAQSIEINLEPTAGTTLFHEHRHGRAGLLVPEWVDEILQDTRHED